MAESCLTVGCTEVLRLGLMDRCTGAPTVGANNGYVVGCIRNVTVEPITREGDVSEFISDCGRVAARDKQDDQVLGYTISFETAQRSSELEALVTGKTLIASGGENIGVIEYTDFGCNTVQSDPRFSVELFQKLSVCETGADHVRIVIPNVQFGVTELDKEGQITYYRYTGTSESSNANAYVAVNAGPFDDLPVDIVTELSGAAATDKFAYLDFSETITISGSCGTIPIPA